MCGLVSFIKLFTDAVIFRLKIAFMKLQNKSNMINNRAIHHGRYLVFIFKLVSEESGRDRIAVIVHGDKREVGC